MRRRWLTPVMAFTSGAAAAWGAAHPPDLTPSTGGEAVIGQHPAVYTLPELDDDEATIADPVMGWVGYLPREDCFFAAETPGQAILDTAIPSGFPGVRPHRVAPRHPRHPARRPCGGAHSARQDGSGREIDCRVRDRSARATRTNCPLRPAPQGRRRRLLKGRPDRHGRDRLTVPPACTERGPRATADRQLRDRAAAPACPRRPGSRTTRLGRGCPRYPPGSPQPNATRSSQKSSSFASPRISSPIPCGGSRR